MGMIGNYMGAALGKSVSDFGGMMVQDQMRQSEEQRKNAYEELRDQKKIELSERLDKLRRERDLEDHGKKRDQDAEFAEKKTKATQERLSKEGDEVRVDAAEKGKKRDVGGLINIQSQIAGDSPNASPEEMEALLADPKNRTTYEKAGYVKPKTQIGEVDDQIESAKGKGYFDTAKSLSETRSVMKKDADTQNKDDREERKSDQKDRQISATEARDEQRHREALARLEKMGSGSRGLSEGERKTYTALMNRVGSDIKTATSSLKDIYSDEEKQVVRDNIALMQEEKRTYMTLLAESQSGGGKTGATDKADKQKAASAPYPDGTRLKGKDGKSYVVKNGQPVLE